MEQINDRESFLDSMTITLALNPPLPTIYSKLHAVQTPSSLEMSVGMLISHPAEC